MSSPRSLVTIGMEMLPVCPLWAVGCVHTRSTTNLTHSLGYLERLQTQHVCSEALHSCIPESWSSPFFPFLSLAILSTHMLNLKFTDTCGMPSVSLYLTSNPLQHFWSLTHLSLEMSSFPLYAASPLGCVPVAWASSDPCTHWAMLHGL